MVDYGVRLARGSGRVREEGVVLLGSNWGCGRKVMGRGRQWV